ncbi:MAG: aminoacyl-tRNA hydrolase [Gammaproteobacteria bacterium]
MAIKLIVGLGNPGKDYQAHRHNAGFWFVEALAHQLGTGFNKQSKFFGETSEALLANTKVRFLKPQTFMNCSGQAIQALANYFNIEAEEILVVHDELDLNPGTTKLKKGGGHSGHNGLRDTIKALDSKEFYRLRIGVGHPGNKNEVVNFVLNQPSTKELALIEDSMGDAISVINQIVEGKFEEAMKQLHTVQGETNGI